VVVVANADRRTQVRTAIAGSRASPRSASPVAKDGTAFIQATLQDPADSDAAADTVERVRTAVHAVPGADALAVAAQRSDPTRWRPRTARTAAIIPLILAVVFVILALLLRALVAPLLLIATVVLSFGAALGISGWLFRHALGFAGADRRCHCSSSCSSWHWGSTTTSSS
jgi:RND superfamily putative drug exporter